MEKIVDAIVLHRIGLERFTNHTIRALRGLIAEIADDVASRIGTNWPMSDGDRLAVATSFELRSVLSQINARISEGHRIIAGQFKQDLEGLADVEASFQNRLNQSVVRVGFSFEQVSRSQIYSAVLTRPMQGKYLADFVAKLGADEQAMAAQQIRISYLEGESTAQAIRRIRNVSGITQRRSEALVRTSMTHLNANATRLAGQVNKDAFPKWQFLAVLDRRTSDTCRSLAGKVFEQGKGPYPPRHPNCRSTPANIPEGLDDFGGDLTFSTWLNRQDNAIQRDVLGPTRYRLWKKGGAAPEAFHRDSRLLTLDQLRKWDEQVFKRAGL